MIEIEGLVKKYDGVTALKGIDLVIPSAQLFGLLGPNGAGKTTALKVICTLLQPTEGTVRVLGKDVRREPDQVRRLIGYVPESGMLYESLTGVEYLQMVGRIHHLTEASTPNRISELCDRFELGAERHQLIQTYSKGMRQKLLIGAALLHEPPVLLLDEPLEGLDVKAQFTVKEILRDWTQNNRTVIYSSHLMEVVEKLCPSLAIIHEGQIVATGSPDEVMQRTQTISLGEAFLALTR